MPGSPSRAPARRRTPRRLRLPRRFRSHAIGPVSKIRSKADAFSQTGGLFGSLDGTVSKASRLKRRRSPGTRPRVTVSLLPRSRRGRPLRPTSPLDPTRCTCRMRGRDHAAEGTDRPAPARTAHRAPGTDRSPGPPPRKTLRVRREKVNRGSGLGQWLHQLAQSCHTNDTKRWCAVTRCPGTIGQWLVGLLNKVGAGRRRRRRGPTRVGRRSLVHRLPATSAKATGPVGTHRRPRD